MSHVAIANETVLKDHVLSFEDVSDLYWHLNADHNRPVLDPDGDHRDFDLLHIALHKGTAA